MFLVLDMLLENEDRCCMSRLVSQEQEEIFIIKAYRVRIYMMNWAMSKKTQRNTISNCRHKGKWIERQRTLSLSHK